jgi:methyl-accepting chemotaxis protein
MSNAMKTRKRFYVHRIQAKYAFLSLLFLSVYTFILSFMLFLPLAVKLLGGGPLKEQVLVASQFIALSDLLWPALLISVPLFLMLSLLFMHRLVGPIPRLIQSLKQMAEGNLDLQIRFRSTDDLQELAILVERIVEQQGEALEKFQSIHRRLKTDPALQQIQDQIEELETYLKRFKIRSPTTPAPGTPISTTGGS